MNFGVCRIRACPGSDPGSGMTFRPFCILAGVLEGLGSAADVQEFGFVDGFV
jgi:hypothetical protein